MYHLNKWRFVFACSVLLGCNSLLATEAMAGETGAPGLLTKMKGQKGSEIDSHTACVIHYKIDHLNGVLIFNYINVSEDYLY